jgi:hypothetical protein
LSQPTPLSILHLPFPGTRDVLTDHIYVAGRFTSILHYDRKMFPRIQSSIYSGASLSSLACLPYPFSTLDSELRRKGELSAEQVRKSKTLDGGRTIVACGEYNTKGSLELYGLLPDEQDLSQNSTMNNRQTCAASKILSVINHGTCLVFSDSSGNIKWFERDGFTEVRRRKIGHNFEGPQQLQSPAASSGSRYRFDDLARKILSTATRQDDERNNRDDILFWTGERLGLATFSTKPGFSSEDFEAPQSRTPEEEVQAEEEKRYADRMRRALALQADEVRFVRNLGLGMQ